jgi:hypothetical protein
MAKNTHAKDIPKKPPRRKGKRNAPEGGEESCRCKEVAEKTPKELLKLAANDLFFWKKNRKR